MKFIDLFAGAGGMTEGFKQAGHTPILAVENDINAAATYRLNHGQHMVYDSIENVRDIPKADIVIGGPPCQGFSNLGSKDINDPRNKLWKEFVRVVYAAQPEFFVIENVGDFARSTEYDALLKEFTGSEYNMMYVLINAADYGVPQKRYRAFVVGQRHGWFKMSEPTHTKPVWPTVRYALQGIPFETYGMNPAKRTINMFGRNLPGSFRTKELHLERNISELSKKRYRFIPPGGNRFDLPTELTTDAWRKKTSGTVDVMGRMEWDKPSLTIRTEFLKPEKGRYLHPEAHRTITHWEAARLQTFSDNYLWAGSKKSIARQIGNAVPPLLARYVADALTSAG